MHPPQGAPPPSSVLTDTRHSVLFPQQVLKLLDCWAGPGFTSSQPPRPRPETSENMVPKSLSQNRGKAGPTVLAGGKGSHSEVSMPLVKAAGPPGVPSALWALLTFPLCPGQGLPLPPQQAAQPVPQTTQQVLGEAYAEPGLWARPSSLLGASCHVLLLLLLPSLRPSGDREVEGEEGAASMRMRGHPQARAHLGTCWEWLASPPASPAAWAQLWH